MNDRLEEIRERCKFTGTYPAESEEPPTDVAYLLAELDTVQQELDAYRPALARCASEYQALHGDNSQGFGCAAYWLRQEGWQK